MGVPRSILVSVGAEWVNDYGPDNSIQYSDDLAEGFYRMMRYHHHMAVFCRGNGDADGAHFNHPDLFPGCDSLNNVDAVNFCYFSGHGGNLTDLNEFSIAFGDDAAFGTASTMYWKLGVRALKWIVFDTCSLVCNAETEHVLRSWAGPMKGVHIVFGTIGPNNTVWSTSDVGSDFADWAGTGRELSLSWLEAASSWVWTDNVPIAIAAGVDRADAVDRRDHETTDWRDRGISNTNALAWMYREDNW